MTRILLILISFFSFSVLSTAQIIQVPQNKLLQFLLRDSLPISYIESLNEKIIPASYLPKEIDSYQHLVKDKSGLYIFLEGTGILYKAIDWDNENVRFKRLDSTNFAGYNYKALNFIANDTAFSFGGSGFWYTNGQLRYFSNEHREWYLKLLDKQIPFCIGSPFQFDSKHLKLYWYLTNIKGEQFNERVYDSIYLFDFNKREVYSLGNSCYDFKNVSGKRSLSFNTPNGVLELATPFEKGNTLIDFKHNAVLTDNKDSYYAAIFGSSLNYDGYTLFYQNGYIYHSYYPYNSIDSIRLDFSAFKNTGQKIYTPKLDKDAATIYTSISTPGIIISLLSTVIASLLFYIFYFNKKQKLLILPNPQIDLVKENQIFSSLEMQLLQEIIICAKVIGYCTCEELNHIFGVSNKSTEIQKKSRNDFINKINNKFKTHYPLTEDLISRRRSETDKRTFLYSISDENRLLVNSIIMK